ncbi:MAG: LysR family transcriptional regulator, partial [Novosphingobium sp.]
MPRSSPARPPRRSNAEYRWTRDKVLVFLRVLALRGSVAKAAREVEMSRQSAYRLRARLGAEFARIWDDGLAIGAALRRDGLVQDGRFVRGPQ